jgi:hypothetical protein
VESARQILSALGGIKLLLAFICIGMFLLVAIFFWIAAILFGARQDVRQVNSLHLRQAELDDLLASGKAQAAKFTAQEWVTQQPRHPEAHWALAKAHHQLGELAECKQVLKALLKVAPEEHYRVDAWLGLLDTEFSERRPRPVD